MSKDRFKQIVAVHLVLKQKGKILLQLRQNTGYEDGSYSLPGGHVEQGETAIAALQREMKEELCIEFDSSDAVFAHVMHRKGDDHERIDFFFTVQQWLGAVTNGEPEKCGGLVWADSGRVREIVTAKKTEEKIVPYIASALESIAAGELFSQFGW